MGADAIITAKVWTGKQLDSFASNTGYTFATVYRQGYDSVYVPPNQYTIVYNIDQVCIEKVEFNTP